MNFFYALISFIFFINCSLHSQIKRPLSEEDKTSLEGIIVEKYYIFNTADNMDTTGGCLYQSAVTYRIYVDLKPDYSLQAVYGVTDHPLYIKTSTTFFNNVKNGHVSGDYIDNKKITANTAAFDSWLTIGAATSSQMGILKTDDKDGSIIKIKSFETADGLITKKIKPITYFGILPDFFNKQTHTNIFSTDNGSWAVFGGIKGPTEDNKILIAQITTDGELSFELNLQVGRPGGGTVNYVARNPQGKEIKSEALTLTNANKIQ